MRLDARRYLKFMRSARSGLLFLILLLVSLTLFGCSTKKADTVAEEVVRQVQLTTVSALNIENRTDLASLLEAGEETTVAFEVSGRVLELWGEEGDQVQPGDSLARLEAAEYQVQMAQAEMALNNARITYQQALDVCTRLEQLFAAGAVSQTDLDNAKNGLAMAENGKQTAERSYGLVSGKDLLKAPIQGVVIQTMVTKGQLVGPGTPAYRIGQISKLKVVLPVPDYEIKQWKLNDAVTLTLYGEAREGKVTKIHPATNKGTGTIGVEVAVPNPHGDWHPGQVIQVSRKNGADGGMYVPVQSVINRGEKDPFVFVAVDGRAVKKPVKIGKITGQYLEITSGLAMGEQVVSRGADHLFDGDRIEAGENGI